MTETISPLTSDASALAPVSGMIRSNDTSNLPADKAATAPGDLFILHRDYWVHMQNYASKAINIPGDSAKFKAAYGDFTDETSLETCVTIFGTINKLASDFGDPKVLIQKINEYTNLDTPPKEHYGHVVWLANKINLAAQTIHSNMQAAFGNNGENLGNNRTERKTNLNALLLGSTLFQYNAADVADVITQLNTLTSLPSTLAAAFSGNQATLGAHLTLYKGFDLKVSSWWIYDQDNANWYYVYNPKNATYLEIHDGYGLNSSAQELIILTQNLTDSLSQYNTDLDAALNGPTNSLAAYLKNKDNVYNEAKQDKTDLETEISSLQDEISEDNKKYIGFTVAACASAFMLFIPIVGVFCAVADAVTFGVLAEKTKQEIDSLKDQVSEDNVEEQQKIQLIADVQSLNTNAGDLSDWGKKFLDDLGLVIGSWAQVQTSFQNICDSTQEADLDNMINFLQNVRVDSAYSAWKKLEDKSSDFISKSFAQYTAA